MTKRIGLLWDSVHDNMGDKAIGLLLQRAFETHAVPYHAVNPFAPDLTNTAALVIGGGELIRAPSHPFFDVFRVPGRHILNSVGVLSGENADYLADYRFVSVRSQMDRDRLGYGEVVPCPTLLFADYLPASKNAVPIPAGAVGIQIHRSSVQDPWAFVQWLRKHSISPTVWLSVMHYADDYEFMKLIARYVPDAIVLPKMEPDDIFRTIGQLRFLVSSSLHATYFAYAQGIPFIAWTGVQKTKAFLSERHLLDYGFEDKQELMERLSFLLNPWDGFSPFQARDRMTCQQAVAAIIHHAQAALSEPAVAFTISPAHSAWLERFERERTNRAKRILLKKDLQLRLHAFVDLKRPKRWENGDLQHKEGN